MLEKIVTELGPWSWWVLGFAFLTLEIIMPGFFLLWIGLGAILTGTIALVVPLSWSAQIVIFSILSLVFAVVGRRFYSRHSKREDNQLLNRRGQQFIGRTVTLEEDMTSGESRVKIGDTFWIVRGPDHLEKGAQVTVVSADGATLHVEAPLGMGVRS